MRPRDIPSRVTEAFGTHLDRGLRGPGGDGGGQEEPACRQLVRFVARAAGSVRGSAQRRRQKSATTKQVLAAFALGTS